MTRSVSTLLITCWLWTLALAAWPELHEATHGEAEHECAAMLLVTGSCDAPDIMPELATAPVRFAVKVLPRLTKGVPAVFLVCGLLEHGPPAAFA